MTEELTAEKALEITIELWTWLSEAPERHSKHHWPRWDEHEPVYGHMPTYCPLCACSRQRARKGEDSCTTCLLYGRWGNGEFCDSDGSPFADWREATRQSDWELAQKCAKRVADIARDKLNEMLHLDKELGSKA